MHQLTFVHPQGGIRRGPRRADKFTILSNEVVNDTRLSFRARGVLIWLLSKPVDWRTRSESIAAQSDKDGRDAVRSAMRELADLGYLVRVKMQDPETGQWSTTSTVYEIPADQADSPAPGNPVAGDPVTGEPGALPRTDLQRTNTNQPSRKAGYRRADVAPESVVVVDPPKIKPPSTEQLALVNELAAASQKAGLTATWRYLKPQNVAAIAELVETHGAGKLLAHAKGLHNPVNPTRFASGWIPMWKEMPRPHGVTETAWTSCGDCDPNGWIESGGKVRRCACKAQGHRTVREECNA
ncbi:helix-turn-helix DNA-binding domain protein [Rhodococcus phage Whack]|uniref:Helix-turn-helix DNA binding domain protein n=1 Tax=Rhodococcus phage Whack TaxID=2591132 RepID=A0A515MK99_9CAUD|nr:HTH DNA binding protein [Rhodococcus phage Whack]QDM57101.1 helix-turn-helix DNA-binding domain protein [Rhodococcus phage Whack]